AAAQLKAAGRRPAGREGVHAYLRALRGRGSAADVQGRDDSRGGPGVLEHWRPGHLAADWRGKQPHREECKSRSLLGERDWHTGLMCPTRYMIQKCNPCASDWGVVPSPANERGRITRRQCLCLVQTTIVPQDDSPMLANCA